MAAPAPTTGATFQDLVDEIFWGGDKEEEEEEEDESEG